MSIDSVVCRKKTKLVDIYKMFNSAPTHGYPAGIALVVDENRQLIGTITDGDIRRKISERDTMDITAEDVMQTDPICFYDKMPISDILKEIPKELSLRGRKSKKFLSKIVLVDGDKQPTRVLEYHQLWEQKVADHRHIVVVGLGYVGLTMSLAMAETGFKVTGVDVDKRKTEMLAEGKSYVHEVGLEAVLKEQINHNFFVSERLPDDGDVYVVSVGTPIINKGGINTPTMVFVEDACSKIAPKLKRGNLVILRSTVPIGTCRGYVLKCLEEFSGLKCGIDFHLSFAPERTTEGDALRELRTLPQIIGGYNKDSLEATAAVFRDLTPTIVKVDTLESAEMAKLINNTFRDYVFAYSNQLSIIATEFNINIVDVISAANEGYPRNPVPLPSPGVGGPCLTKDPHIFAYSAQHYGFNSQIFTTSRAINESIHSQIAERVLFQIQRIGKEAKDCNILICGLAFKGNPETGDLRNSSSIEIANLLKGKVKEVFGYDAVATPEEISQFELMPSGLPHGFNSMDVVMFLNNHKSFEKINVFEMTRSLAEKPIVFDGWNIFRPEEVLDVRPCVYMGLSFIKSSIIL